jgi:hypothetical protein
VGVRNSSGLGSGVGSVVGANNISAVDSGVDFLFSVVSICFNFKYFRISTFSL